MIKNYPFFNKIIKYYNIKMGKNKINKNKTIKHVKSQNDKI